MLNEPERPRILEPVNMKAGDKLPEGHRRTQKTYSNIAIILLVLGTLY